MKGMKKTCSKILSLVLTAAVLATGLPQIPAMEAQAASTDALATADSAKATDHVVEVTFNGGALKGKITFLEDGIFRYNVDPSGVFSEYAKTVYDAEKHPAKIPQYPDSSDNYSHPAATVSEEDGYLVITSGNTKIKFEKSTAKMSVEFNGKTVMEESKPLVFGSQTTQSLVKHEGENFYGGGTQNGRFLHTGEVIQIANNGWEDGGVASPNPFYYTSEGYGVLRNTFLNGVYDFGSTSDTVATAHRENEFDAYYFLSDGANAAEVVQDILHEYYHVTGNPILLPEYAFYEGHLNAYNRDSWSETSGSKKWTIKGSNAYDGSENLTTYFESGMAAGYRLPENAQSESLNGEEEVRTLAGENYPASVTTPYKFSARAVIDQYIAMDMPLGYFLPNDGYGAGYGQNGYYVQGGVNNDGSSSEARLAAVDANVENLAKFTEYANSKGVATGLWTQSYLVPDSDANTYWHLLRDFHKEVTVGGVTTLKTDVAWVGPGYNQSLSAQKTGFETVTTGVSKRPNIISLCGWAGTQRFAGIWTGDQHGGNWGYIRFHIPTYIGQSLSGNPNVGSDMDSIYEGTAIHTTRDTQWKIFTPTMLNMDGWGNYAKTPHTFGDPYTGINRMYLKLKAQLLPYIYTSAASAANIDTKNTDTTGKNDAGLPMIRAMFLEYPNDGYAATKDMQYQYMFGKNILVAPVYTETAGIDKLGNDVRNGIYLPDENQVWIDYFTGKQYNGGQVLNNFDAPIWKLPVFVKNGAIIPMWEENNTPENIDKSNRIAEFWPAGSTEYTLYEDDGETVTNATEEINGYGTADNIDYGSHVSTKYTSVVKGTTATLTAEKSTGSYTGYNRNKNTTFVVNVSAEPTAVTAKNGNTTLTKVEKNSKDEVLNANLSAGEFAYYYDEAPAIETYAVEGETQFAEMMNGKVSSPKLYVKFAETDSQANAQVLTIEGFENVDEDLDVNRLDENLGIPQNLRDSEEEKTPTSNTIQWDEVTGATSYDVEVDGNAVNNVGNVTTFTHLDLAYNSTHTYKVRARGANGYSEWSSEITATTQLDPWRNVPDVTVTWTGGDQWGALANATDHNINTQFHSTGDVVTDAVPFIMDLGDAYILDKFEYYARHDNYGHGAVKRMDIYTSLDGEHWIKVHEGTEDWTYDATKSQEENKKTVTFNEIGARYVKLIITKSTGNFFSADELIVYKKDGTDSFAVGSTNKNNPVAESDYTTMKNYLGISDKDSTFVNQIQNTNGDINYNGIYEVYDYAYTMFKLDGGTKKTGSVSGKVNYQVSEADGKIKIDVVADNVQNLNAFGQVLNYDPAALNFESVTPGELVTGMENLTVNKTYDDGTAYVNLAFANKGDKALVNGSGVLATITMVPVGEGTVEAIDLSHILIMGPDFSFAELETSTSSADEPKDPELSEGNVTEYGQSNVTITMTNAELTEDDGTNVTKLIQQKSYDALFNGKLERDFEFLWDWDANYDPETGKIPTYVTLPLTMHIAMNEAAPLNQVAVYNANKANGYVTEAKAVLNYTDGTTSEEQTIALEEYTDNAGFEFAWADSHKEVASVDVTILKAIKGNTGEEVTNMMTLAELTLGYNDYTAVTGISAEGNVTELEVGATADITAVFTPENVTNPYFRAESSDPAVAEVVAVADENGYKAYQVKGVSEGTATITLTALDNEAATAEYTVTVSGGSAPVEGTVVEYGQNDVTITMTNAELTEDDGTNVTKLIQQKNYDGLFNGTQGRDFEFLWDVSSNYVDGALPAYVTLPLTMHIAMNEGTNLNEISVFNANKANGFVTKVEAVLNYSDGTTSEKQTIELTDAELVDNAAFKFAWAANKDKTAVSADITILKAIKGSTGEEVTNMMTLSEMELKGVEYADTPTPVEVDKEALATKIEQAESLTESNYTPESWANMTTVLGEAKAVYENADATQDEVNAATAALTEALDGLEAVVVPTPVDKKALAEKIKKAESLNRADYTEETWNTLAAALEAAKTVNEDADATQDEVNAVAKNLQTAIDNLKKVEVPPTPDEPVNKDALDLAIKVNVGKTEKDYTAESWKAFQAAYAKAQAVLADKNATQAEVNAALMALESAAAGLKNPTEVINPPSGNTGSSTGSTSTGSTGSTGSNVAGGSGTAATGGNASTGDSAQPLIYLVLIAAAVAGFVFFRKKKAE